MSAQIHPLSVVSPDAVLGDGVVIGPFCVVEGGSRIGARTVLRSHVVVGPHTEIGEDNDIYPHCTLGMGPQDLKFKGAPTRLKVGDRNVFRESCTLHRGTEGGGGLTTVGDGNFMMTGSHVAHDCHVGSNCIFANSATLAGHVEVGDFSNIGAFSAVHQFCRVGAHAFMGGFTVATMDVLPYMKTAGARDTKSYGVNTIGLRRKGFPEASVEALVKAHRILFHSGLLREEALAKVEKEFAGVPEIELLTRFIRESKRGIHRG
ncbi:acyl-ACP--UDP-N-acetylglucosamine O-acyltransferase [Mesoterricola silvestris]|uniref:Acyl-[acyl-carrier-protein]--UDP-N-acetylglucosamine O-acyltransferase n=1 Tax=Mesoterricola silvestris TaxID=2927979 RepID=A0AA48GP23_9BACT|nr:acyl-ACP--UDP-N-acetylglucosamine O-acyltransferase [Mesoterricola silvestris]BDU73060.1 acyl-[acyl-carrier-protein]--UDP-N-acetylglucosamine O-acyltransferase [Mesoterricola silvestris]